MIIDTHAHYNLDPFFPNWKEYWQTAQKSGIEISVIPGADIQTSKRSVEIAQQEDGLYAMVGVHPHEANNFKNTPELLEVWKNELEDLIHHPKVVAVGECGLDYFRLPTGLEEQRTEKNMQKRLFGIHIQLAKKHNLPLSIHCRDAYTDLLDTLNHFSKEDGKFPKGVLHCASGDLAYLKAALEMGMYVGFAGNITYKNAENIRTLAINTPIERVLIETDMPYLPPASKRGQVNRPEYICETYTYISQLLKIEQKELEKQIEDNTRRFFSL